jgi:hypothetical protein
MHGSSRSLEFSTYQLVLLWCVLGQLRGKKAKKLFFQNVQHVHLNLNYATISGKLCLFNFSDDATKEAQTKLCKTHRSICKLLS